MRFNGILMVHRRQLSDLAAMKGTELPARNGADEIDHAVACLRALQGDGLANWDAAVCALASDRAVVADRQSGRFYLAELDIFADPTPPVDDSVAVELFFMEWVYWRTNWAHKGRFLADPELASALRGLQAVAQKRFGLHCGQYRVTGKALCNGHLHEDVAMLESKCNDQLDTLGTDDQAAIGNWLNEGGQLGPDD